jgi:hypothetical protein
MHAEFLCHPCLYRWQHKVSSLEALLVGSQRRRVFCEKLEVGKLPINSPSSTELHGSLTSSQVYVSGLYWVNWNTHAILKIHFLTSHVYTQAFWEIPCCFQVSRLDFVALCISCISMRVIFVSYPILPNSLLLMSLVSIYFFRGGGVLGGKQNILN